MAFKETLAKLKASVTSLLTSDSSKEEIDKITGISNELDSLESEHNKLEKENTALKDDYIAALKKGSNASHQEDNHDKEDEVDIDDLIKTSGEEIANKKKGA